jgi:hypothetical protein
MKKRKHLFAIAGVALVAATTGATALANESSSTVRSNDAMPVYAAPAPSVSQPVYSDGSQPVYATPAYAYSSEPYVTPTDQPRYTPETGNAEYGSKLNPYTIRPLTVQPPSRFNDATGQ